MLKFQNQEQNSKIFLRASPSFKNPLHNIYEVSLPQFIEDTEDLPIVNKYFERLKLTKSMFLSDEIKINEEDCDAVAWVTKVDSGEWDFQCNCAQCFEDRKSKDFVMFET